MSPIAFYVFGRPVFWYGIIIALGVLLGIYLGMRHAKVLGYDQEMIIDFALLALPMAIIGARLYYVVFSWEYYSKNLLDAFKVWEGGLAIFGVVIGGVLAAFIFTRRRNVAFWDLCDIGAPSLILGQALGRWGNFFNQEAYGYAIKNPAWQWFPAAVFIDKTGQWHMATFFYESMWNFVVFFLLFFYMKRRKKSGEVFLLYLIFYSIGRVVIEGLRTDSLYWGQFRVSQLLSGILIIAGIAMFIIRRKKVGDDTEPAEGIHIGNATGENQSTEDHGKTQDIYEDLENEELNEDIDSITEPEDDVNSITKAEDDDANPITKAEDDDANSITKAEDDDANSITEPEDDDANSITEPEDDDANPIGEED